MNDQTKAILTAVATKTLAALAAALATHGVINTSSSEVVVSVGLLILSVGGTVWNEYLRDIIISQLEVLKAKSLAQADAMRKANLPPVTATQIADKGPDHVTPAVVLKVMNAMPADAPKTTGL